MEISFWCKAASNHDLNWWLLLNRNALLDSLWRTIRARRARLLLGLLLMWWWDSTRGPGPGARRWRCGDVERAVDHLEEPRVQIGWEVGFGLGRVLEEGVQTGLGWVVLGTADSDPVEET